MATLKSFSLLCSSSSSYNDTNLTFYASNLSSPKLLVNQRNGLQIKTLNTSSSHVETKPKMEAKQKNIEESSNSMVVIKELYAIMEIAADRAERHKNIGVQRDNWNSLLLNSVNVMTVTAAIMAGLATINGIGATLLALKLSSTLLYLATTGILRVMNKIQPSQLAEEQRNASRLFKKLKEEIKTTIAIRNPTSDHVKDAMEKVLALDDAYPLALLGSMLNKFPTSVEPAVWWPKMKYQEESSDGEKVERNGWNGNLEEEMKEIIGILKMRDSAEYKRQSKLVLKVNKNLAICGPLFTCIAAIGTAFVGYGSGSMAAIFGVVFGVMATVVNTLEHGGQIGMVFEMYRGSAGFLRLMEETIESALKESEVDKRENGQIFRVKVALELGRSLSELKSLAGSASHSTREAKEEFASKLIF